MTLGRHECSQFSSLATRTTNANTVIHYVKLGKKRRESSKWNCYIISQRVIIKAIIIRNIHLDINQSIYICMFLHIERLRNLFSIVQCIKRKEICTYVQIHKCNTCACIHTTRTHEIFPVCICVCVFLCVYVSVCMYMCVCVCVYL